MSTIKEISEALNVLKKDFIKFNNSSTLQFEYPTMMKDVNLLAMKHLEEEFGTAVGYSDHTLGIEVPVAAVALGATVIEKHFTLDRGLPGPDHKASLTPDELSLMVNSIRNVETAISGSGIKEVTSSELKNKNHVRKGVYFKMTFHQIPLLELMTYVLRPYNGCSPMILEEIIGAKTNRSIKEGESVTLKDLIK